MNKFAAPPQPHASVSFASWQQPRCPRLQSSTCNAKYREARARHDGRKRDGAINICVIAITVGLNRSALFWLMAPRKKTLEELKNEAIAELERRGYDVRGKTPAQIRQMLRARPSKRKSNATSLGHEIAISQDNHKKRPRGRRER